MASLYDMEQGLDSQTGQQRQPQSDRKEWFMLTGAPQHWATSDPEGRELIKPAMQEITTCRILQLKTSCSDTCIKYAQGEPVDNVYLRACALAQGVEIMRQIMASTEYGYAAQATMCEKGSTYRIGATGAP